MKFQFITSVAAVLLSSGHGVFAAKYTPQNCQMEEDRSSCSRRMPCVWVELTADNSASMICCEKTDLSCILQGYGTSPAPPAPLRAPQNCQKEEDGSSCSRRMPCLWVKLTAEASASRTCCEKTDSSCILGDYGTPAPGTMFPTPTPPLRPPRHSQCVKLGEDAVDMAKVTMCGQAVAFPWKDNSQLMDCRDIATQTCRNKLADQVMQSCGLNTDHQEVIRACTEKVDDLLTGDYYEPFEEEKFDYSYLSEDNKMDPYGEDFDSSTSEDFEMVFYDDFFAGKRANKMRRKGANKKKKLARNSSNKVIKIGGNAKTVEMKNGKCPSSKKCTPVPPYSCICPEDSYLSEDNKMDFYGEDFDSSTSEDVEMESYNEDFYAVY